MKFMKTSYGTVKKRQQSLRGEKRALRMRDEIGISFGAVQSILSDILGMSNVSTKWVPQMLTNDQKSIQLYL